MNRREPTEPAPSCDDQNSSIDDDDFLAPPIPDVAPRLLAHAAADARIGALLGSYRLVEVIAVGGMGTVYLAERADEQFEMKVAIKVLHESLRDEAHVRAFERERRLLARFNHPQICRLVDGGTTHDGSPYLIMEWIQGRPLLEHCHEKNLDADRRLILLIEICDAIQSAHLNLVLHRDLKPSNLLVTDQGRPKVIDFGIGWDVDENPDDGRMTRLTPPYASPEQTEGGIVTTASDVYSLGIILSELLPAPRAPEIDSLIEKATRELPELRFPSASRLAEDIRNYREHRPISAHEGGPAYHANKFVRRHRIAVVTAGSLLLLIVSFAVAATILARNLEKQRRIAIDSSHREAKAHHRTERINRFLIETLKIAAPDRSGAGASILDALQDAGSRIELELGDDPETAARVHIAIAETYSDLGWTFRSEPHLRAALSIYDSRDDDRVQAAEIRSRLGGILAYQNRPEGLDLQREALALFRSLPDTPETKVRIVRSLHSLGFALYRCVQPPLYDEARATLSEALAIYREVVGKDSRSTLVCIHALAAVEGKSGNLEAADELYRTAAVGWSRNSNANSGSALECRADHALCLALLSRFDEAKAEEWASLRGSPPRLRHIVHSTRNRP